MRIEILKPEVRPGSNVKSVVYYAHPTNGGVPTGKRYKQFEAHYNPNGLLIECLSYEGGKITSWLKYVYGVNQELSEVTHHEGWGYDKANFKPITHKAPQSDLPSIVEKPVVEITPEGMTVESMFYKNGKLKERKFFSSEGSLTEEIHYRNGTISVHKRFSDKGLLLEHLSYSIYRKLEHHTSYEYNMLGNPTRIKVIRKDKVDHDRKLIYDEQNRLIEDIDIFKEEYSILHTDLKWGEHNEVGYRHKYSYNPKGLLALHEMFLGENLIMKYEFIYEFGD